MSLYNSRRGMILYVICALLIFAFLILSALENYRSGSTRLLKKNIEQEEMMCLAQVGVSEILADIKSRVNNKNDSLVGSKFYNYFKSSRVSEDNGGGISKPNIPKIEYSESDLDISNRIASEQLKRSVEITGSAEFIFDEVVGNVRPSYLGRLVIKSRFKTGGTNKDVEVTESRDLKYVDLSDSFFDRYALYVKSYCRSLNEPDKHLILNGLIEGENSKSLAYFGNRKHPTNPDVKNILLDLDFQKDKELLGGVHGNSGFDSIIGKNESKGNFFWTGKKDFKSYFSKFSLADYKKINIVDNTLQNYWQVVVDNHNENSTAFDAWKSGEDAFKSSVLRSFREHWKYYYGYTDYTHVRYLMDKYPSCPAFRGLFNYFQSLPQNSFRRYGGKMPEIYGVNRDRPIFIEGPVYLRFFKCAFIDQARGDPILNGRRPFCSAYALDYPRSQSSIQGKDVGFIDQYGFSKVLGSHPIDDEKYTPYPMPANLVFYQQLSTKEPDENVKGYDIFPRINTDKLVCNYYLSPNDFYYARAKEIDGEVVLDLDGINVVLGDIDLDRDRDTTYYRGKGTIVSIAGDCILGNLKPYKGDGVNNYLKIYLTTGSFAVSENRSNAVIHASLAALYHAGKHSDDNLRPKYENTFQVRPNQSVTIEGNLLIDNLYLAPKSSLTVTHTEDVFNPDYPIRISIGPTKLLLDVNYGK